MPGDAFIYLFDFSRCPTGHDSAAFLSAARAHVDDVISIFNDIKIMLDDNDRRPMVNQRLKNKQQRLHILRMQTDRGFIKNKHSVALAFSHLAGKL